MHDAGYKDKANKLYPANHVIGWYLGNYLNSPNNAIRKDPFGDGILENQRLRYLIGVTTQIDNRIWGRYTRKPETEVV